VHAPGAETRARSWPPGNGPARVRVLYVGGAGRSGTTLLARILDGMPHFTAVGELIHLWRGLSRELCGCGMRLVDCPFWTAVGKEAFGGWSAVSLEEMAALQRAVDRTRCIPLVLRPGPASAFRRRLATYLGVLERLYGALAVVGGDRIIVDTSKHPSRAFLLARLANVDVRIVHVVRSSQAVAYSAGRVRVRPEVVGRVQYMARSAPARSALEWVAYNALTEAAGALGTPLLRLRYEDLAADLRREVGRVLEFADVAHDGTTLAHVSGGGVRLRASHSVSGNPGRFMAGQIPVAEDVEWLRDSRPVDRALVTAVSWPLLVRYGYSLSGRPLPGR
jgi:hypothetical protein